MDYTLIEIKKHKNKISELSAKLNNTLDINEEITINNELTKESEFLVSLLNIKKNEINRNYNMPNLQNKMPNQNNFNNDYQQMLQQQMIQQQMLAQQQMMAAQASANQEQMNNINFQNNHEEGEINVKFNKKGKIINIKMDSDSMVAELINEYFVKSGINSGSFKFNNKTLSPCDTETLYEIGLKNNSEIIVS